MTGSPDLCVRPLGVHPRQTVRGAAQDSERRISHLHVPRRAVREPGWTTHRHLPPHGKTVEAPYSRFTNNGGPRWTPNRAHPHSPFGLFVRAFFTHPPPSMRPPRSVGLRACEYSNRIHRSIASSPKNAEAPPVDRSPQPRHTLSTTNNGGRRRTPNTAALVFWFIRARIFHPSTTVDPSTPWHRPPGLRVFAPRPPLHRFLPKECKSPAC
jgi:hypothetical protein